MKWIEVENTTRRKVPRWLRSAGLAEDGTVFVPAAITGNEQAAILSASWDGSSMALHLNHAFLPCSWVVREHPNTREACEKIERKVREFVASGNSSEGGEKP